MNNKNLQNKGEESEILSAGERRISELVGSLERVSAPKDFDFRLKARIAAQRGSYQTAYWRRLRYIIPAGAAAFVLAFVFYAANFFAPSQPVDSAAQNKPENSPLLNTKPGETSAQDLTEVAANAESNIGVIAANLNQMPPKNSEGNPVYVAQKPDGQKDSPVNKKTEDNFNGSSVESVKAPIRILPPGINENAVIERRQGFEITGIMTAKELLQIIGAETGSANDKLTVKSVKPNSLADRSGLKVGDIVEAVNGQKITDKNPAPKFNVGESLTVSRGGENIEISLKQN